MPHTHRLDEKQIARLHSLQTDFFQLSSVRELRRFSDALADDSPVDLAFAFLIGSWTWHNETFERSLFYWNPVGVRETPEPTDADFVILETSLRFVL